MSSPSFMPLTQRNFNPNVDIQSYFKQGSGECNINSETDDINVVVLKREGSKAKTLHILKKYANEENSNGSGHGILKSNAPTGPLSH